MTREERSAVLAAWRQWSADSATIDNQTYTDFYFSIIRQDRELGHVNVFEVLDILVNAESQRLSA